MAGQRLDAVDAAIEEIAAKLEFWSIQQFSSSEDYDRWFSRALSALVHYRVERTFIFRWMLQGAQHSEDCISSTTSADPLERMAIIKDRLDAARASVGYETKFGIDNPPSNDVDAVQRRVELNVHMDTIERLEKEIRHEAYGLGMTNEQWRNVMSSSFTSLKASVKKEQRYLRDAGSMGERTKPVGVLLRIIERAQESGYHLNEQELAMYLAIKSPIQGGNK